MVTATAEMVVLWSHIVAGFVALCAGAGALVTEKGGDRHRFAGRIYVRAMGVVVGTVPLLLAFDPTDFGRQFLLLVAVFSGYLVFSGYRVLSRKRPAAEAHTVDWGVAGFVVFASLGLVGWGAIIVAGQSQGPFADIGVVMVVFGLIGGGLGLADLRGFRSADRRDPWIADHLSRMIAGYIATVTAVSVVNLTGVLPGFVVWLWPTAVGVPLIWFWQAEYADSGPVAKVRG